MTIILKGIQVCNLAKVHTESPEIQVGLWDSEAVTDFHMLSLTRNESNCQGNMRNTYKGSFLCSRAQGFSHAP